MNKTIQFTFLLSLLLSVGQVFSQCDECTDNSDFVSGYCFTSELLPGKCAQFALDLDYFVYQTKAGKKTMHVPLPKEASFEGFMPLLDIKKLKAADIVFIAQALQAWEGEASKLELQKVVDMLETATYKMQESGLGIHILKQGLGEFPPTGEKVTVHYRGFLANGTIFDESYKRGKPFSFTLGARQVIGGWDEGIAKLPIGTRAILKIPPALGYGERGAGASIPPNATLYFQVEVLK